MKTNVKTKRSHLYSDERLAGGMGNRAAKQDAESQLRRCVMSCMLWENIAYETGGQVALNIQSLVPKVDPEVVAAIAVEARDQQKLRHVPLYIVRLMAALDTHKHLVADTLFQVVRRPDELTEFLSIYWKTNKGKTLSAQVKRGLARAFQKFNRYQLSKWDRSGKEISIRDVMFLVHPTPKDNEQGELWKELANKQLGSADTWEVSLSAGADKRETFERLLSEGKLGASAFLKNLRNMTQAGVARHVLNEAFNTIKTDVLVPLDFIKAAVICPEYTRQIESMMFRSLADSPKLSGHTIFVVDISGSMNSPLASKSIFTRMEAGLAMAVLASEMCDSISVYATAGNDGSRIHKTRRVKPYRGFALSDEIRGMYRELGGGGIFTRQCLEYIYKQEQEADRIIVFSDSQDCDLNNKVPKPFGKYNYIIDVSCHKNGVNYDGVWTAEIAGWSEAFLKYIYLYEQQLN